MNLSISAGTMSNSTTRTWRVPGCAVACLPRIGNSHAATPSAIARMQSPPFADVCSSACLLLPTWWPPSSVMNSRRLVCRERSIVRGDEGRIMTRPPSRPEARSRLGCQTANELGAPVASSIPEQLPGHEPASARMGYEDGHALFLRYRRVEGPLGRRGAA